MQSPTRNLITPVAAAVTAALYPGFTALAQDADDSDYALEEIIVTATKREVSMRDIPAQIQAITQESLAAMGARGMEDYARFMPSVNVVTYSGSGSTVVFRGAITGRPVDIVRIPGRNLNYTNRFATVDSRGRHRTNRGAVRTAGHSVRLRCAGGYDAHPDQPAANEYLRSHI